MQTFEVMPEERLSRRAARALRDQVDVRQGRTVSKAKDAPVRVRLQHGLERVEAMANPSATPSLDIRFIGTKLLAQGFENASVVDRVNVAADDGSQRPHVRTRGGVSGQKQIGRAHV